MKTLFLTLTAFLLISTITTAQIIYTDPNPDINVSGNATHFVDINNDGLEDFKFLHEDTASGLNGNGLGVAIMHLDAEFLGGMPAQDPTHYYPYKLNYNTMIDINANGNEWVTKHPDPDFVRVLNLQFNNNTYAGLWVFGVTNEYLGIRIRIDGFWHYGWIRLDVNATATQMLIKDWAYESIAGQGILAGANTTAITAGTAMNVVMTDVGNTHSAADVQVAFSKANDESGIEEYRIMIVKETMASTFGLVTAENLPADRFRAIVPNGLDQTLILSAGMHDAHGDAIQENIPYVAFVLSFANGSTATINSLSQPSMSTSLLNTIGIDDLIEKPIKIQLKGQYLYITNVGKERYRIEILTITGKLVFADHGYGDQILEIPKLPTTLVCLRVFNRYFDHTEKIISR